MSYRKDQGRYARMLSFWGLTLLVMYGCFYGGGLVSVLDRWLGESNQTYVDPFPLLGQLKLSTLIALGVLLVAVVLIRTILTRPRVVGALVETEGEMRKVTWPTWGEAWQGTMAVTVMVIVLFVFLAGADVVLLSLMAIVLPTTGAGGG